MIEELKEIREQLFDAPSDVKESFNNVVQYFDKGFKYCLIMYQYNRSGCVDLHAESYGFNWAYDQSDGKSWFYYKLSNDEDKIKELQQEWAPWLAAKFRRNPDVRLYACSLFNLKDGKAEGKGNSHDKNLAESLMLGKYSIDDRGLFKIKN